LKSLVAPRMAHNKSGLSTQMAIQDLVRVPIPIRL
jgi:hypothetical protein